MEENSAKELDSSSLQNVFDLKRKKPACDETCLTGANQVVLPLRSSSNSSIDIGVKRRKLNCSPENTGSCFSHFSDLLIKNYLNFTKSGLPQRIMYFEEGMWADYPEDFIAAVKKELLVKKPSIHVEFSGISIVLDFLHMIRVDLQTGLELPIAVIDDLGSCFFPETCTDSPVESAGEESCLQEVSESQDSADVKLQFETTVNSSDVTNSKGSSGESALNAVLKAKEKPSCVFSPYDEKANKAFDRTQKVVKLPGVGVLDKNHVEELFMTGMIANINVDTVKISRGSSNTMLAQIELFEKQIEITEKLRGNANVRCAWLPCCIEDIQRIMKFGLSVIGMDKFITSFGAGVYLFPANCSKISASYCIADEKGERHMVLCHVILGKMEIVPHGSKQFHPSSEGVDSAVDDFQDPGHYVVWNMNVHTHIFPEYAVTFKVSSDTEGLTTGKAIDFAVSGGNNDQAQVLGAQDAENNEGSPLTRSPIYSGIPFLVLFARIANKISSRDIKFIKMDLDLFRRKMMSGGEFFKKFRLIVGDRLWRFAIMKLNGKGNCHQPQVQIAEDATDNMASTSTRAPQSLGIPFAKFLSAIALEITSKELILIEMDYELFMGKAMSRNDFVKKLMLIAGDHLFCSTIMNFKTKELPNISLEGAGN